MSITMEEKIALLEEVGMKDAAEKIKNEIEIKAQIEKLAGMDFKPITEKQIWEKICHSYKKPVDSMYVDAYEEGAPAMILMGLVSIITLGVFLLLIVSAL